MPKENLSDEAFQTIKEIIKRRDIAFKSFDGIDDEKLKAVWHEIPEEKLAIIKTEYLGTDKGDVNNNHAPKSPLSKEAKVNIELDIYHVLKDSLTSLRKHRFWKDQEIEKDKFVGETDSESELPLDQEIESNGTPDNIDVDVQRFEVQSNETKSKVEKGLPEDVKVRQVKKSEIVEPNQKTDNGKHKGDEILDKLSDEEKIITSDSEKPIEAEVNDASEVGPENRCGEQQLEETQEKKYFGGDEGYDRYDLKNGTVGQEYTEILDFDKIYSDGKIKNYTVHGLEEIGLDINRNTGEIAGVPVKHGDPAENFESELIVRYETETGSKEGRRIYIKILPDPKTMWKTIEPDENLGDWKKHEYKKQISINKYGGMQKGKIIAASKRGRSHAHKALFRDDHVSIRHLDEIGWSILIVADGAGGAKLSRVGSAIACETAVDNISEKLSLFDDELSNKIVEILNKSNNKSHQKGETSLKKILYNILSASSFEAAKAIQQEAKKRNVNKNHFHTTYLTAIYKAFDTGHFFSSFWVGDGAIGVYTKSRDICILGSPDEGEYSGQTKFITMNDVMGSDKELSDRIHYKIVKDFTALLVMSDGVSDPMFGTVKNLNSLSYWDDLWTELERDVLTGTGNEADNLLNWMEFWAEGEHDDRTMAILY